MAMIRKLRADAQELAAQQPREHVDSVIDVDADGVLCRLYRPAGATSTIIHLHGGGFVFHDIAVHDAAARRLANRAGMAVLSVDYRRPPQYRFPAAPDDASTAVRWLQRAATGLGLTGSLLLHGDSAGGNLALVTALRNPGVFSAVALIYPFLDPTASFDSYSSTDVAFDRAEAAWYWRQYAAKPEDLTDPDLAPLLSDQLGTLPPTLVVTSEHDPLRDEGEELALRLAEAGVSVVATRYLGQLHGFWRHVDLFDAAEPLTRQVAGFFNQHAGR
ncbi:alpha/beta hydrolase [Nocardioides marmorisolisilvae]|uniref:Alpha/beta hydrolase n=2 Tax=Nocardioides marmorisolisilvae TaxID=1542737 RepID=A0A3N0DXJ2_9ACTN|nr:alpha/beta hydrolase [Nocardioides marmorisolisilvae]